VYPVAFIEFPKDSNGKVTREGPRREKEELVVQDAWAVSFCVNNYILLLTLLQRQRECECQRLRKEVEDKQTLYLDWARRFEIKSGVDWRPVDNGGQTFTIACSMIIWHTDDMPEHIESMFDDCEYASDPSSVLRRVSKSEAGWLARFARERAQQEMETLELGLEKELQVMSALYHAATRSRRGWRSLCVPRAKFTASAWCCRRILKSNSFCISRTDSAARVSCRVLIAMESSVF
jgi:breast cancer 2 susceptibility protein